MNFQCKGCGGNVVFDPETQRMYCESCGSYDTEDKVGDTSVTVCASCGGEIAITDNVSADRCPYCGNFLVFDPRVEGELKPRKILPFMVSRKKAVETLRTTLKRRIFAPVDFLGDATFKEFKGMYVPFFMYDYDTDTVFSGTGNKVRTWVSGNKEYTETSYFRLERKMRIPFRHVPADASPLDDQTMDELEPFPYDKMQGFDPKLMSGFYGYIYDAPSETYEPRIQHRLTEDINSYLSQSYSEYSSVRTEKRNTDFVSRDEEYVLLPVWQYPYKFKDKSYECFVNGVTGKVIGKAPVAAGKVIGYSAVFVGLAYVILSAIWTILELV